MDSIQNLFLVFISNLHAVHCIAVIVVAAVPMIGMLFEHQRNAKLKTHLFLLRK